MENIKATEFVILLKIKSLLEKGVDISSYVKLSYHCDMSIVTVKRTVKILNEKNYINLISKRGPNGYVEPMT